MSKTKKRVISREDAHQRCEVITGKRVLSATYPGGKSRESWRVLLGDGKTVIVTRRKSRLRADLEIKILGALSKHDVHSPKLIGSTDWRLFVQEDLGGKRLSSSIMHASEANAERLLAEAIKSLSIAQQAATKEGLDLQVPILGGNKEWIVELLERPTPLAQFFKEPVPVLNIDALTKLLGIKKTRFVKWDSRPGNAIVRDDGSVYWFDWEHAGARNRLDDMAWLLADEFVPYYPTIEQKLIETHLNLFADGRSDEEAKTYLMVFGTFHMLIRLGLILTYKTKGKKKWWDINYCIAQDKIGITLECAERTCFRASRWAAYSELTRPLIPLIEAIQRKLKIL